MPKKWSGASDGGTFIGRNKKGPNRAFFLFGGADRDRTDDLLNAIRFQVVTKPAIIAAIIGGLTAIVFIAQAFFTPEAADSKGSVQRAIPRRFPGGRFLFRLHGHSPFRVAIESRRTGFDRQLLLISH